MENKVKNLLKAIEENNLVLPLSLLNIVHKNYDELPTDKMIAVKAYHSDSFQIYKYYKEICRINILKE